MAQELDILNVISEHTKIERKGSHYFALCPFHNDTKPSLHIDPVRGLWYCFGCFKGGNVQTFLREIGQEVAYEISIEREVANYWHFLLVNTEKVLSRLEREGLSLDEIKEFKIGYSKGETKNYLLNKGYSLDEVEHLGILNQRGEEVFSHRIIFPVISEGKVRGFCARGGEPKYLYNRGFRSKEFLFGWDNQKHHIKKENKVYVVEGVRDFFALRKVYPNVLCSFGCSLSYSQLIKISRLTDELIFCFDGDEAGSRGVIESLRVFSKIPVKVSVAILPLGKDPKDLETLGELENIKVYSLAQFFFEKKLSLVELAQVLAKYEREVYLEEELKEASLVYRVSSQSLIKEVNRFRPKEEKLKTYQSPDEILVSHALKHDIPLSYALFKDKSLKQALFNENLVEKAKLLLSTYSREELKESIDEVLTKYTLDWAVSSPSLEATIELVIAYRLIKEYLESF